MKISDQISSQNETFQTKVKGEKISTRGLEFLNQYFVAVITSNVSDFTIRTKENIH